MGRRLAEATKACRTRRTRGEMALRFFLVPLFLVPLEAAVFLEGAFLAGAFLAGAFLAGDLAEDDVDWADAGGKKPSESRKKIPAKTKTAKRRTQTLPTAESWHS